MIFFGQLWVAIANARIRLIISSGVCPELSMRVHDGRKSEGW